MNRPDDKHGITKLLNDLLGMSIRGFMIDEHTHNRIEAVLNSLDEHSGDGGSTPRTDQIIEGAFSYETKAELVTALARRLERELAAALAAAVDTPSATKRIPLDIIETAKHWDKSRAMNGECSPMDLYKLARWIVAQDTAPEEKER